MKPYYKDSSVCIIHGDCLEVLPRLASADAVVTDPPYGLSFMGEGWDHGVPGVEFWQRVLAAMKPGAYLLAFGGTRTYHRLTCAIEDAGFEPRDCLMYLYGVGFPKSLDVSKQIDKAAGAEREVVGKDTKARAVGSKSALPTLGADVEYQEWDITAPATDAAKQWEGWGTALKPSWEPIILARKPLAEKTVAANVLEHGTGGLNIDASRIPTTEALSGGAYQRGRGKKNLSDASSYATGTGAGVAGEFVQPSGRWPANLILECACDGPPHLPVCPAGMLDAQSGQQKSASGGKSGTHFSAGLPGVSTPDRPRGGHSDFGGASRFFYCAKTSSKERREGNMHPTVKPLALMRWLVRLVTPLGGIVLDPFMGSGTTLMAARAEGMRAVGIEIEEEYCEAAAKRLVFGPGSRKRPGMQQTRLPFNV